MTETKVVLIFPRPRGRSAIPVGIGNSGVSTQAFVSVLSSIYFEMHKYYEAHRRL